ncbi:MAG: hypothetical protein WCJ35_03185 [Planctomycetota bacterium]
MNKSSKPDLDSGCQLLHNMSVAPQTVITYEGGQRRIYGKGIVFRMPDFHENLTPAKILTLLDESVASEGGTTAVLPVDAEAEDCLRQRIEAHARTLALPPAAIIVDSYLKGDRVCKDLISVVTVLAKSSDHVYLRDKQPNLAAIRPGRRVVVLLPPEGGLP